MFSVDIEVDGKNVSGHRNTHPKEWMGNPFEGAISLSWLNDAESEYFQVEITPECLNKMDPVRGIFEYTKDNVKLVLKKKEPKNPDYLDSIANPRYRYDY